MDESEGFRDAEGGLSPAPDATVEHAARETLRGIAPVTGLAGFSAPIVYLILIFMPGYAVRELGLEQQVSMLSTLVASSLLVLLLVPMGWLGDRVGSRPLIVASSPAGTALVVPLMEHLTQAPSFASL